MLLRGDDCLPCDEDGVDEAEALKIWFGFLNKKFDQKVSGVPHPDLDEVKVIECCFMES
jgi:hypothetical protein